jgi:hypothetical protein
VRTAPGSNPGPYCGIGFRAPCLVPADEIAAALPCAVAGVSEHLVAGWLRQRSPRVLRGQPIDHRIPAGCPAQPLVSAPRLNVFC